MRYRKAFAIGGAALLALAGFVGGARAQADSYPSRPITLLVPFPPGGSADTVIRPMAQKVADALKQPIVIDNRPGGGGNVAAVATKQAAPDGYTLFLTNMGVMSVNPILTPDLRFDPVKDFQPITPIISFPHILVVPADSPAKNRRRAGGLGQDQAGRLELRLAGRRFRRPDHRRDVQEPRRRADGARAVPRRGARRHRNHGRPDRLPVHLLHLGRRAGEGRQAAHHRGRRQEADRRGTRHPDHGGGGFAGLDIDMWHGMVAPAGTPAAIVQRLNQEFIKAARGPDIVRIMAPQATDVLLTTPDEFRKMIAADTERLGKIIRDAGIKGAVRPPKE